ncbi:MAG: DUF6691 family protein [Polyangiales bacterium]
MKRADLVSLAGGLLFAVGLGLSGMTQPAKVLGFLDVFGAWDATLLFVMAGAVGVHFFAARRTKRADAKPVLADSFELPTKTAIDTRLVLGAALFGIGWGASGFCPGPALVSLAGLAPGTLLFLGAMAVGMLAHRFVA